MPGRPPSSPLHDWSPGSPGGQEGAGPGPGQPGVMATEHGCQSPTDWEGIPAWPTLASGLQACLGGTGDSGLRGQPPAGV